MEKNMKLSISYIESVDGGYVGIINEVKGVVSQGETIKELKYNLYEALKTMIKFDSHWNILSSYEKMIIKNNKYDL